MLLWLATTKIYNAKEYGVYMKARRLSNIVLGISLLAGAISAYYFPELPCERSYRITKMCGARENENKVVQSVKDVEVNYFWESIALQYFNPALVRDIEFSDRSHAIIEQQIVEDCSFLQRKVVGPEPGEEYSVEKDRLVYQGGIK